MPRLGLGSIDLSATTGGGNSVTGIDDFFFESFTAGQMHPIRTASRTNLVLQSQTIRTSPWTLENFGTDTDLYSAPNSTTTAQSISLETANDQVYAQQVISIVAGKTYTFSAHLKKGALDFGALLVFDGTTSVSHVSYFNIATGTAQGSGSNIIRSAVDAMGDGWYRCSITFQALSSVSGIFRVYASAASNSPATGSGTQVNIPLAYLWGTQIEENGFPSAYIPTVGSTVTVSTTLNDTSEVWDFDGTDIMIAEDPEDEGFWEESYPDGASLPELVLNGDYEELGSELVASGTFSSFSKDFGDVTISGDTASFVNTGSNANSRVSLDDSSIVANKRYKIVFDVSRYVVGQVQIVLQGTTHTVNITGGVDTYTVYLLAGSSGDTRFRFKRDGSVGDFDFDVDNISVKQIDPNDRWTLGTGWTISGGKANFDASAASTFSYLTQASILPSPLPLDYELTFTLSDLGGSFSYSNAGIVRNGSVRSFQTLGLSAPGTHTIIVTETSSSNFSFFGHPNSDDFSIDNVSIKEYAIQPLDI